MLSEKLGSAAAIAHKRGNSAKGHGERDMIHDAVEGLACLRERHGLLSFFITARSAAAEDLSPICLYT